mmetsp:Transcript_74983/g.160566  ORF Transcript_74983/g.160566 Transcript_74983/m.160566 type:complete len:386 (+) Transcript_74983:81-1238(+)
MTLAPRMVVAACGLSLLLALTLAASSGAGDAGCEAEAVAEMVAEAADEEASLLRVQMLQMERRVSRGMPRQFLELAAADRAEATEGEVDTETEGNGLLSFMHIPCNFGHTIEKVALGKGANLRLVYESGLGKPLAEEEEIMHRAKGAKGVLWGQMNPSIREISNATGCNMYYTPGKYWPSDLAHSYFGQRTIFGVLRDPYDKAVNEFRRQVQKVDSVFKWQLRANISAREGHLEREGLRYQMYYDTCDVNGYLKEELLKYKAGDRFRGNCALVPQADYFDPPWGIAVPVDNRLIPGSINTVLGDYGYSYRVDKTIHNWLCPNISAFSLDNEVKVLIQEVYARDFDLLCSYFGYCNRNEIVCLEAIPQMCGDRPNASGQALAAGAT